MNYFARKFVCEKLAMSNWQSYHFFPANRLRIVRESDVIVVVNESRVALPEFTHVPTLVTGEHLSKATGIPPGRFVLWAKRTKNPIPHVRFNTHCVRYPMTEACAWIERCVG